MIDEIYLPLAPGLASGQKSAINIPADADFSGLAALCNCSGLRIGVIQPEAGSLPDAILKHGENAGMFDRALEVVRLSPQDLMRSYDFGRPSMPFDVELGRQYAQRLDAVIIPGSIYQQPAGRSGFLAAANLLRAGGVLVAMELTAEPELMTIPEFTCLRPFLGDPRFFDATGLTQLLEGVGLRSVSVTPGTELSTLMLDHGPTEGDVSAAFRNAIQGGYLEVIFAEARKPHLAVGRASIGKQLVVSQEIARDLFWSADDDISFPAAFRALNSCVDEILSESVAPKMSKAEFTRISKAMDGLESYAKLARSLGDRRFPPTQLPDRLVGNILAWRKEAAEHYAQLKSGSQPNAWEPNAVAKLLGLYAAAYNATPTTTIDGGAVWFVNTIYDAVGKFRQTVGDADGKKTLGQHDFGRAISAETMKSLVAAGLRHRSFQLEGDDVISFLVRESAGSNAAKPPPEQFGLTWERARDRFIKLIKH